ncbi:hypothetical protein [Enterovibrio sp. 27052020O]|uniref:hypothetical protein n=1 Tax=Enterovibrio sp. 27052020O TaxID=3241166 RepID=UPI00388E184A
MYTFRNTEITNKKSSDYETKSMLYLLGMRNDSNNIEIVIVDCFNDVTGVDENFTLMLDVQSKNYSKFNPAKIGESLFTLYDNFISNFKFDAYILFSQPFEKAYLLDSNLNSYNYENIHEKTKKRIEKKLREVIQKNHCVIDEDSLGKFLLSVSFFNDDKPCSHYIKSMVEFGSKKIIKDLTYQNIFDEIRNKQSSLKNSEIENITIEKPEDVIKLNRFITKNQIKTLIISRIIGVSDIFKSEGVPYPFLEVITKESIGFDGEVLKDLIFECNSNLSRAMFDKGTSHKFWKISEGIIKKITKEKSTNIYEIYESIHIKKINPPSYLDRLSILYLISLVVQGNENEI